MISINSHTYKCESKYFQRRSPDSDKRIGVYAFYTCLLFCLFLLTFELGHTGAIGDTDCTAKILELSKTLVKLKSFIEEMSSHLETEVRLREQLEERVRRSQICQKEEDNVTDGGSDVIVSEPSLKTLTKEKRSSGKYFQDSIFK